MNKEGWYLHNYKDLPYKQSIKQFMKDYKIKYYLYGRFKKWETKENKKIMVCKLKKSHLKNIVDRFGNTTIRTKYPYVWYRYLKDIEKGDI